VTDLSSSGFVIKTGLTGPWNIKLGPWRSAFQQNAAGELVPTDAGGSDLLLLTGVVRRDLGLDLESAEGPVPRVVITAVERPTPDESRSQRGLARLHGTVE